MRANEEARPGRRVPTHRFVYFTIGTLSVLSFCAGAAALSWPWARPVAAGLGVATTTHVGGFLVAMILFVSIDDSLRTMRTAVLGALSGTGLVKAEAIAGYCTKQFDALSSDTQGPTAALFFIALGAGLLGLVGGFVAVRLGFEREMVEEQSRTDKAMDRDPDAATNGERPSPAGVAVPAEPAVPAAPAVSGAQLVRKKPTVEVIDPAPRGSASA